MRYSGPGSVPLGTSASAITSTSIPTSSETAAPSITNHRPGRTDALCLTADPPMAVMIGEPHANATSPPISARCGERRSPSKRRTPYEYASTVRATPMTRNGTVRAVILARPI